MTRTYRDRAHAGEKLASALLEASLPGRVVVLGIPRGGVAVAAAVARRLQAPLGVVVARKLGAPFQPELAIGAVTAGGAMYLDRSIIDQIGVAEGYLARERDRQATEAQRREHAFDGAHRPVLRDATVIVVDDGVATGSTAVAALRAVRDEGAAHVVLAVPVAHPRAMAILEPEADRVVCPLVDPDLLAVGQYYDDFRQVGDDEVRVLLREARAATQAANRTKVTITGGGTTRLAGILSLPAGASRPPCVVFAHGLGSSKESPRNVVVSEALLDAGIATLLFDLSGHGESAPDPRGHAAFAADVALALAWAATQPQLDGSRVGLAGSSLGGVAALDAVRTEGARPAAMVLRAPPAGRELLDGLTVPTLVIAGDRDPLGALLRDAVPRQGTVRLMLVPGAGHLFEEPGTLDRATHLTVDWFRHWLGNSAPGVNHHAHEGGGT